MVESTAKGRRVSLTGIKPTGELVRPEDGGTVHLGNYLGAIRPALKLAETYESIYFIADYHAVTTQRDPDALRQNTRDVAAAWLASGLDPERTLIFRQSHVIEVFELMWVFACVTATGQLERGHAYKDAAKRGGSPNAGIFNYPVLMAADIVLYNADVVPVGADQTQHLELARDIATRVNHLFGEGTVVVPEAVATDAPVVPGTDGRKMSKHYGNTIPLFSHGKQLRKAIMKIQADSTPLDAPKEPDGTLVYELFKLVASDAAQQQMATRLRTGGYGWGHAKQELYEVLEKQIAPMRERYLELRRDDAEIDRILEAGADRARVIARQTVRRVRAAAGLD